MISRLFFRFRAWLILFIFLTLNISVPQFTEFANDSSRQVASVEEAAIDEATGSELEISCLLEVIIEESFGWDNLFPDGDWSTDETIHTTTPAYDIIAQSAYRTDFYPPRVKRLLAENLDLPDDQYPDVPTRPPDLGS